MPAALRYVPTEDVEYWWPLLEPILKRALIEADIGIDEIKDRAIAGDIRLWLAEKDGRIFAAAAMTEIVIGKDRAIHIIALAGDEMDEWLHPGLAEFERLARLNGISRVRLTGRTGWQRVMPDYRVASVILEKRLDGR